jgi:hypothetical protein
MIYKCNEKEIMTGFFASKGTDLRENTKKGRNLTPLKSARLDKKGR